MGSLDIDSIFTSISLEETIEICTSSLYRNKKIAHGLKKSEFKDLLSLVNKESYFILNNILNKQTERVAKRSPLGPSLVNSFLVYYEHNWLNSCSLEYRILYDRR